jgi:hypothetical protein
MNLKAAAAGAFLLLAACGGGGNDIGGSAASGTTSSISRTCPTQTTSIGGNLFVADQAAIGVTLLSDGGLSPLIFDDVNAFGGGFMILYDNVFGMQEGEHNSQDRYGFAKPFPPGTQVGASTQVQLQPPAADVVRLYGPVPSTFPKGIPLQLWLKKRDGNASTPDNSSSSAQIGKDVWPNPYPTASVTYGANNTATVTFFPTAAGAHFSIGLSNVFGTGC